MTIKYDPLKKIIFAGTPTFAAAILSTLLTRHLPICCVLTQPDRPKGRGQQLQPSPVKQVATKANIPVLQPQTLKDLATQAEVQQIDADLMIVAAYGLILPQAVLNIPKYGCINVHASLLPRWRGAAPIQSAILHGDLQTGISIMQMEAGLDTGPVLLERSCPITANDTSFTLEQKLAALGGETLLAALESLQADGLEPQPQDDAAATYAPKIHKSNAEINWHQEAQQIVNHIRAYTPWPVAYTNFGNETIKIFVAKISSQPPTQAAPGTIINIEKDKLIVATANKPLEILAVQPVNSKPMATKDFLNGRGKSLKPGMRFGQPLKLH